MAGDTLKGLCVLRHIVSQVWAGESVDGKFRTYSNYKDRRMRRRYLGLLWGIKKATTKQKDALIAS
jgi:hypothetical protein